MTRATPTPLDGLCATLVGIGLARFAYTPLLPALVEEGWFTAAEAAYLGAANLAGYLLGALMAHRLGLRFGVATVVPAAFAFTVASFVACAFPSSFTWFVGWRLISGVTGAVLVVLGVSTVLGGSQPERRSRAGGIVFSGIGAGILFAATVVPTLSAWSLTGTWLVLSVLALLPTLYTLRHWRSVPAFRHSGPVTSGAVVSSVLWLVLAAYALDAVGFVPHTVFWSDYIARGLGLGMGVAGYQWALFGIGAVAGPWLAAAASARLGFGRALAAALAMKSAGVALPLFSSSELALALSSLSVGALVPAMVTLAAGRVTELAPAGMQARAWGWATAAFAAAQAGTGQFMSMAYEAGAGYQSLFLVAVAALASGALLAVPRFRAGAFSRG
ncbi:YbfB/YjiJ family MFS transporter [Ectothiorhodospiraceae bacterium WFHF3C12]|nr:YbfB/YjiJ family MFS transporter [Ectothiorhodospiraceae bacterium WFHF3C12]